MQRDFRLTLFLQERTDLDARIARLENELEFVRADAADNLAELEESHKLALLNAKSQKAVVDASYREQEEEFASLQEERDSLQVNPPYFAFCVYSIPQIVIVLG